MPDDLSLRPISAAAVPAAVKKAEHYRLLNAPEQAESICLDVLDADPGNQQALVALILAMTDQFGSGERPLSGRSVDDYVAQLADEYQRHYYGGIVRERRARTYLSRPQSRESAYDAFREAMEWYDKAASLRPAGEDEAILRWNACVRTIGQAHLEPRVRETEAPFE